MKKFLAICSTLLLGLTACWAQAKKEQVATVPDGRSLLWKISGNGLKSPSYLFGTIHMICPDDYLWTPAMQKALNLSRKIAFELDMDDPQLPMLVAAGMMLQDGKTLEDFYSKADYQRLKELVDSGGSMLPMEMLKTLKPFAVMTMLATKSVNCNQPDSYEGNIMKIATKDKKEIVGLEKAQDQIDIFEKMNSDSAAQMLLKAAGEMEELKGQFNAMVNAYKQQDLPALYQLIISSPDYKDDLNTLLFDRNRKWIPAIARLSKAQPTFIAVGAGHLWGDEGVINLLRKAGYTVSAVK